MPGAALDRHTPWHSHWPTAAALLLVLISALALEGCQKKPPSEAQIRTITRDLVAAAQSAAGPSGQVSIRPEMGRLGNGHPYLVADDISIDLADPGRRPAVEQALDRAAAGHHLTRLARSASPAGVRFDYLLAGRRTHSVGIRTAPVGNAAESRVPRLAIIIDDIGGDKPAAEALLRLPYPLTLSILPGQPHSAEIAQEAYRRGDEVMLHLPMEFQGHLATAEPVELRVGMSSGEVRRLLDQMLAEVPHVVGVNNHEGSLATAQPELMAELMEDLHERHLFFVDSRTTPATVAYAAAQRAGVPAASRRVFLDDVEMRQAILGQLDLARRDAVEQGAAIAIGHPHAATIAALSEGLARPTPHVRLVFVSTLVR